MTVLVGIRCTDGVVIAADSASTFGIGPNLHTIAHKTRKIDIVGGNVIIAGTGQVGLGQRFRGTIEQLWRNKQLAGDELAKARAIATAARNDFASTGAPMGAFGALVALPADNDFSLCEYAVADLQPELKQLKKCCYVSMGSGQMLADPFLAFMQDVFWKNGPPTLKNGKFAAVWVMKHAIRYAPGGIAEPIDVAILSKSGAKLLDENELQEHLSMVEEADRHLRSFSDRIEGSAGIPLAPPPSLPRLEPSIVPPK